MSRRATPARPRRSRIQLKNREAILEAALEVFSSLGYSGATLDRIAERAGLSKPNLLYYFASKEEIHATLLGTMLTTWLAPLGEMRADGDPIEEMLGYVRRKLHLARDFPRESRLFANEILQGAPRIRAALETDLRAQVEAKAALLQGWMDQGRIARVDPVHLIFSVWSMTQHYADFDIQVAAVLGPERNAFAEAESFLETLFRRLLQPAT